MPTGTPAPRSGYREVTIAAVVFGVLIGAVMNAAITYAGLKIGFTLGGSAIAAVLGFGVLRGILRRGSILETNITQTIASAVNTTNAGVIFTVPVLLLLGMRLHFSDAGFWWITLACTAGAVLGVVFIVPLRKQMLDVERLRFPSATAVAAILKSPGAGAKKSVVLVVGIAVGAAIYAPAALSSIKSPAATTELDRLVERERITPADAARTLEMDAWIAAGRAPAGLVERGRLMIELRDLREALDEGKAGDEVAARARVGDREKAAAALERGSPYPAALAMATYDASRGERPWESLRSVRLGWAGSPLPGYHDIGWRLAAPPAAPGEPLPLDLDRDRNGRPDLVLTDTSIDVGRLLGLPAEVFLVFAIAPFALGAGYLTGRAGLVVLAGGILAYMVLNPIAYNAGWVPATVPAHGVAGYARTAYNQPLGIGLLLGGALMGIAAALPAIREALKSLANASPARAGADEMGLKSLAMIAVAAFIVLLFAAEFVGTPTGSAGWLSWAPPWLAKGLVALVAAAWIWFAGIIIAQCTGMTDWSPISGMALLTVVLVMVLIGTSDVVSAVMLGAALCVAISCAADMMADLKTGYIVGAIPRRQQMVEIFTAVLGPVITMATVVLIAERNLQEFGVAMGPPTDTTAPQAVALKAVITGVQGGEMPYALYGLGATLGALLGIGLFPGLGVLVGLSMYLPVMYILTYGVGCLTNIALGKIKGRRWAEEWGVPFCAGLIVGEAVLALGINAVVLGRG
ncbi:MAG: OPT/YSL family transporter [Phycisphaerales bacterium]